MTASTARADRPIIVCGMYRSGTSLTASLVHAWGAFGGETRRLNRGDPANPRGYFEHRGLEAFTHTLTYDIGIGFWDRAFPDAARAMAAVPRYRERGLELLDEMRAAGTVWFWKHPMLAVWLPFWQQLWDDATYVVTIRHPYASARSWQKDWLPAEAAGKIQVLGALLLQWQSVMLSVLRDTAGCQSALLVIYERVIAHPDAECRRLAEFLSRQTAGSPPDASRVTSMTAAIDPSLMRQHAPQSLDAIDVVTDAQRALYRLLLAKADDPGVPFDPERYELHATEREYLDNLKTLAWTYRDLRRQRAIAAMTDAVPG